MFIILYSLLLTVPNGSLVPGVREHKNKMHNDKGGARERKVGDGEKVGEVKGGRER